MFQLTVLILALISASFGYMVAYIWSADGGENTVLRVSLPVFGALCGLSVGMLLTAILRSASAMVFVAFAENPDALKVQLLL